MDGHQRFEEQTLPVLEVVVEDRADVFRREGHSPRKVCADRAGVKRGDGRVNAK